MNSYNLFYQIQCCTKINILIKSQIRKKRKILSRIIITILQMLVTWGSENLPVNSSSIKHRPGSGSSNGPVPASPLVPRLFVARTDRGTDSPEVGMSIHVCLCWQTLTVPTLAWQAPLWCFQATSESCRTSDLVAFSAWIFEDFLFFVQVKDLIHEAAEKAESSLCSCWCGKQSNSSEDGMFIYSSLFIHHNRCMITKLHCIYIFSVCLYI